MADIMALVLDALVFVLLPWLMWRLTQRTMPIVVLPILVGITLAVTRWPLGWAGIPSLYGTYIGWVAVLVLAFTAGLEMWQHPGADAGEASTNAGLGRLLGSALFALLIPFVIGTTLIHRFFLSLPGWQAPGTGLWIQAMSIGLCLAVSALPVLIGLVRELGPHDRPLGQTALKIAVVDDAALWIGLAGLEIMAKGTAALHGWTIHQFAAVVILVVLALAGRWATRHVRNPPVLAIWAALPIWLAGGAWASMQLGLHELIGAYFAGAVMPPAWVRRLPVEQVGTFALIWLAPLFFGHSGLNIDGRALTWPSVLASVMLVVMSVSTKIGAVVAVPPVGGMRWRDALGVGSLLQCKGLMEIVAATILHSRGMISEFAFASLMVLAVASTTLTGPLFRMVVPKRRAVLASA
ncbi:Na+/H+ antiporter [Ameyamaea chiangmaiensis NBRC 103196]|uniref:Cation:proton antiporter n=1 Tax=Ameyamaea chiangmaiensis TaxID=442969 RepID=A0A850P5Z7_9PROT|nr:cation:proton antiporter [Ameyamaea chiangmaiensis]MBS4074472.1 cation:proton antiporter [Ameyamaea chiangmaiensis]NVN39264.1 cation:proton antiporter [Ameyamaea chiangmaiensis]GBQ72158.1 Na+/H+ antiporter [Ameyamaea chiangmaiensis NBRC 103196]